MPSQNRVSSPAATGGAGTYFEQHVAASFLALLLVRGIPPICLDCGVIEVYLQNEHLGWNTDDILVVGASDSGQMRRLVVQVKRTLTVSYSNDDFKGAVLDAWLDFLPGGNFNRTTDKFVFVTLRGSNTLLSFFSGLLECARVSRDGNEFKHRLTTRGLLDLKVEGYCDEVRKILDEREGRSVTFDEIRDFLSSIYLLSLDLDTGTSQTEAWVKTQLAHTSNQDDPITAANNSWNALLRLVGSGTPQAASYRREDLPEELLNHHTPVTAADDTAIQALRDHTDRLVAGIRAVIGESAHLNRSEVIARILDEINLSQVVLVVGEAGSGKSGVAKSAVEELLESSCVFAFRAEQFAETHLDATFAGVHPRLTASKLRSLLATHDRKTILVESVERLLEASSRGAFTDLMTMVAEDPTWRLILTCRDYSSDLVRSSFLEYAGLRHSVVTVPVLSEDELAEVQRNCPHLSRPLDSPPLRLLLKNPYFLDMAAKLTWTDESTLPANERSLRKKFWREVIRDEGHNGGGMPRRREQAFIKVSLRRARSLTAYSSCDDLDGAVIDLLRNDSLLRLSPITDSLAAAAHDVLEDWALLEWIGRQFETVGQELSELRPVLGTYPAIRRTYKKWLAEQIVLDPPSAEKLLDQIIGPTGLPQYFVDDTIVSLLRSTRGSELLGHRWQQLVADDKRLLLRVMHLLRVGCVRTPSWAGESPNTASIVCVPDGSAWAVLLNMIRRHVDHFSEPDCVHLLSFVEDWSRGVSWQTPYPEGANDAAAIVLHLLPKMNDYSSKSQRERLLKILLKLPLSERRRFVLLMNNEQQGDDWDGIDEELSDLILFQMDGMPSCRDLPDEVIAIARKKFIQAEKDSDENDFWRSSIEMEQLFGLQASSMDCFPASAYQGPFLFLLRHHPRKGIAFIIELMNHATERFAHPQHPVDFVDLPVEMILHFADGTTRAQWVNKRLWNLYRGTSVGPDLLQSALMALELWLMEVRDSLPNALDAILVRLLRESNSAAITSVVASLVTSSPAISLEAGLILLRSQECIILDKVRRAHESQAPGRMMGLLSTTKRIYDIERNEADAMEHRSKDLEVAVLNLQSGSMAVRVREILDEHRASLPPLTEQGDDDRIWRLALDRMDLRQYRASIRPGVPETVTSAESNPDSSLTKVFLEMEPSDPDIQEMVDRTKVELSARNSFFDLLMWGNGRFERDLKFSSQAGEWRARLQVAQQLPAAVEGTLGGIDDRSSVKAYVAAVCIRDHWAELTPEEQEWCICCSCDAIAAVCDETNGTSRCQRYSLSGDRPAAYVLSALYVKELTEPQRQRVLRGLAQALTHGIEEVADYAVDGLSDNLWTTSPDTTVRCINALARQAELLQNAIEEENRKPFVDRRITTLLIADSASIIREIIEGREQVDDQAYLSFNTTDWVGTRTLCRLLAIARNSPSTDIARQLYRRASETLQQWWRMDKQDRSDTRSQRSSDLQSKLSLQLERFVLTLPVSDALFVMAPIFEEVEASPREVSWICRGLICAEVEQFRPAVFWPIWSQFAELILQSNMCEQIDSPHRSRERELVSTVFLGISWNDETRHWRSIEGYSANVDRLFLALPPSASVFEFYVRFLSHIGEQSLPVAFVHIATRLRDGQPSQLLSNGNTVFMLESLLRRYVYGRPMETKRDRNIRDAVLCILDCVVEAGSSAAYRMRDDFVTPIPGEV